MYLAVLNWQEIKESSGTLPKPVKQVLADFEDVMPDELHNKKPPRREVDHGPCAGHKATSPRTLSHVTT